MGSELRQRVLVIGDSLVASAEVEFLTLRAERFDVRLLAEPGRRLEAAPALLASAGPVDHVVVALGTNNVADSRAALRHLIDRIVETRTGHPLALVNVGLTDAQRAEAVNATYAECTTGATPVRLIDWAASVETDPALLGPDGIHLSAVGRSVFAATVLDGLDPSGAR